MLKQALSFLAMMAIGLPAPAQPAVDCSTGKVSAQAVAETKALMASLTETMGRQDAELDAEIREATARAKWSEQDRARFFQTVLRSQPNAGFDQQIAALTAELRAMAQAAQRGEVRGAVADCRYVARMRELVGQLNSVYERQSAYLTQQLRTVKPARRP